MRIYFFTGSAAIGSLTFEIASARFPEHAWRKLVLDSGEKQAEFDAEDHKPDLIISFLNPHILPAPLLDAAGGRAYNVHPSPPSYPGNDPQHFAVYDGQFVAGATLHVMTSEVDSGPIVDVVERPLELSAGLTRVRELSANLALSILLDNLSSLVDGTVQPNGRRWNLDNKHSRADFLEMCRIEPDISPEELQRRLAAFYQPSYRNKPFVEIHGARFVYDPGREDGP